jgi:hypothetical protein
MRGRPSALAECLLRCSWAVHPTHGLPADTPDEETSDWRAVCGRIARTVRRAGRATPFPTPIARTLMQALRLQFHPERVGRRPVGTRMQGLAAAVVASR